MCLRTNLLSSGYSSESGISADTAMLILLSKSASSPSKSLNFDSLSRMKSMWAWGSPLFWNYMV